MNQFQNFVLSQKAQSHLIRNRNPIKHYYKIRAQLCHR